jgi:hypothetical protein
MVDLFILELMFIPSPLKDDLLISYVNAKKLKYIKDNFDRLTFNYLTNVSRCCKPFLSISWRLERVCKVRTFCSLVQDSQYDVAIAK